MNKIVFVCPQDNTINVIKVTSKDSITKTRKCPTCQGPMNFIRKNKKKYKVLAKRAG
jgi:DNA replicative helicase MCM subunit Mcm2 (Cdc46/Mcm family)